MTAQHNSKRRYVRVKMIQKARLEFPEARYGSCRIKDLNLTGIFVFGRFRQQPGDTCIVGYSRSSPTASLTFTARAEIVRARKDGIALEFKAMPLDSYILLQSTLLYEAVDPLVIMHELPADCPFELTDDIALEPSDLGS